MRLRRAIALLLTGLMVFTSVPANTLQVYAEEIETVQGTGDIIETEGAGNAGETETSETNAEEASVPESVTESETAGDLRESAEAAESVEESSSAYEDESLVEETAEIMTDEEVSESVETETDAVTAADADKEVTMLGGSGPALHDEDDDDHYTANGTPYNLTTASVLKKDDTVYGYQWNPDEGDNTILLLRQDDIPNTIMTELKSCNTLIFGNDITEITISVMANDNKLVDNENLKKVDLNKVTKIGKEDNSAGTFAFGRCVNLETVVNMDKLEYVGYGAFYWCKKLTEVNMPECKFIDELAFYEDDGLETVSIPKCEVIINMAFARCDNLTTIDISGYDSSKTAEYELNGYKAFEDCIKLENVTLGPKATELAAGMLSMFEKDKVCNAIKNIDLTYVTKCNSDCLSGTSIEHLVLPNCTEIERNSFRYCPNLQTIEIPKLEKLGEGSFYQIPQDLRVIGGSKLTSVVLSDNEYEMPSFYVSKSGYKITLDKDVPQVLKNHKWSKTNRTVKYEGSSSTTTGSVKSISLSDESLVLYSDEVTADKKVSVKAYLTPANATDPKVKAAFAYDSDDVVSAATVGSYSTADGYYPVEITLTGNTGKARVMVKETKSGVEAICTVNVKEKDKVYAPYSVNIQGDGSEYGDLVGLGTQTLGAQIFYVLDNIDNAEPTVWDSVSWNDAKDKFESSSDSVREYKTPLVLGVDSDYTKFKLHAVAFKKNMISSDEEIFELAYFTRDEHRWGDVNGTDKDREFGGDVNKLETEEYQGIWAPEWQLRNESIVYTGKAITIPNLRIYFGNKLLKEKTDYTLKYSDNVNSSSAAKIKVTLKGNYSGSTTLNFTINKLTLSMDDVVNGNITYSTVTVNAKKDGDSWKTQRPDPRIYVKSVGKTLKPGVDYSIAYKHNNGMSYADDASSPGVYSLAIMNLISDQHVNYVFAKSPKNPEEPDKSIKLNDVIYCIGGDNMVPMSKVTVSKVSAQKIEDWKDSGYVVAPAFTVTYKGKSLTAGDEGHYTYEFKNNTAAGTASLIIRGTNKDVDGIILNGSRTITFKISGIAVNKNNTVISGIKDEYTYTGIGVTPAHTVTYNGDTVLTKGVDYDVTYAGNKNINAGKVNMTFKFKGKYAGSLKASFKIVPVDLTADDVSVTDMDFNDWNEATATFSYVKNGVKPEFRIRKGLGAVPVKEGKDYTVTYANNKAVGAYDAQKNGKRVGPSMTIKHKGNFKGNLTVYFTIESEDIAQGHMQLADLVASTSPNKYTQKVVITDAAGNVLKAGTDYDKVLEYTYDEDVKVTYKTGKGKTARTVSAYRAKGDKVGKTDIIPSGTVIRVKANGIKNYKNSISDTFTIAPAALKNLKFSVDPAKKYTYTGHAITPGKDDIKIQKKEGRKWVNVTDAELAEYQEYFDIVGYKNNVKIGSGATITLKGKNGYAGTVAVKFKIVKRAQPEGQ